MCASDGGRKSKDVSVDKHSGKDELDDDDLDVDADVDALISFDRTWDLSWDWEWRESRSSQNGAAHSTHEDADAHTAPRGDEPAIAGKYNDDEPTQMECNYEPVTLDSIAQSASAQAAAQS